MNLEQAFDQYLPLIEAELRRVVEDCPGTLGPFYRIMGYHLGWYDETLSPVQNKTGKRIRPLLCVLTCRSAGGMAEDAVPAAAAIELIHNFSLVHDDIQDRSPMRRHRKTVWRVWGEPHAINVGDGLFALAFLNLPRLKAGISGERMRTIYQNCAQACVLLCEGQYMDMSFERRLDVTEDEYMAMIGRKTAALLGCASQVGALVAGEGLELADTYRVFGEYLGLAFQVQDDILGAWGDPIATGKMTADDILQCKKTLPVVYALQRESELGGNRLRDLYEKGSLSEDDVPLVLEELDRFGALAYARRVNNAYCDKALKQLQRTSIEAAKSLVLEELVERLRERST